MKKILLLTLIMAGSSILFAKTCSEEQIANMIKQGLSQTTIDSACTDNKKETNNDKQVVVNIINTPVNNNTNTNTNNNTNTIGSNNTPKDDREYFFWRIGLGIMSISEIDFSESGFNVGVQYFINGLKDSGFGIGLSLSSASSEEEQTIDYDNGIYDDHYTETITTTITTSELELMYNIDLGNNYSVTPAYIIGSASIEQTQRFMNDDFVTQENISGFGVYLNFPSIVRSGQGLSIYAKQLSFEKSDVDMTLAGLQFTW